MQKKNLTGNIAYFPTRLINSKGCQIKKLQISLLLLLLRKRGLAHGHQHGMVRVRNTERLPTEGYLALLGRSPSAVGLQSRLQIVFRLGKNSFSRVWPKIYRSYKEMHRTPKFRKRGDKFSRTWM